MKITATTTKVDEWEPKYPCLKGDYKGRVAYFNSPTHSGVILSTGTSAVSVHNLWKPIKPGTQVVLENE